MKRAILALAMLIFFVPGADACVGKLISIGVLNSSEGQLFSEILGTLITERTGTTVNVKYYPNMQELYEAVRVRKVDITVENTARAMQVLGRPAEPNAKKAYEYAKEAYEKDMGLIWLKPFGFQNGGAGNSYTAAILRAEILNNFPVLPRVLSKLVSAINDETYAKLIKSIESGEKPKKVARDFLKSRKLI